MSATNVETADAMPLICADEVGARDLVSLKVNAAEYVVWRDDAGAFNLWEDRCCHRGVRLSIGTHTGTEVKCRYHGWLFGTGGACTFIPAHPNQKPPAGARSLAYPCTEKYGLLWLQEGRSEIPAWGAFENTATTTLRSVTIHAGLAAVRAALESRFTVEGRGAAWIATSRSMDAQTTPMVIALLPENSNCTTVHSVVRGTFERDAWLRLARAHNDELKMLRTRLESA